MDKSSVVSSAEVGLEVVVGIGGEDDDNEMRRAMRGSDEGVSEEVAMLGDGEVENIRRRGEQSG